MREQRRPGRNQHCAAEKLDLDAAGRQVAVGQYRRQAGALAHGFFDPADRSGAGGIDRHSDGGAVSDEEIVEFLRLELFGQGVDVGEVDLRPRPSEIPVSRVHEGRGGGLAPGEFLAQPSAVVDSHSRAYLLPAHTRQPQRLVVVAHVRTHGPPGQCPALPGRHSRANPRLVRAEPADPRARERPRDGSHRVEDGPADGLRQGSHGGVGEAEKANGVHVTPPSRGPVGTRPPSFGPP